MPESAVNNKRIAKNTFFMYFRTLCTMLISLYTSRVVLHVLGVDDFGIYNIVGSVVVMFSFLNGAMTSATQRYLSFELGKNESDRSISTLFSACLNVHIILALIIVFLAETVGLWFLNYKMNFPAERMAAVNFIYQFSIIVCAINVVRIPYNASIISHESFTFYAYMGIIEAVLKLGIVYLLQLFYFDKLKLYSVLIALVAIVIFITYYAFHHIAFKDIRYSKVHERSIYKQLISFSGWTIFGSFANMGRHTGVSVVNNIYYGVAVNAAIGIAQQVNGALDQFVSGFQQAFNPQLTKTQAIGNKDLQHSLICRTSKFSFYILLLFTCPLIANLDYVLGLWLGDFPPYTKEICVFILLASLIDSISGPLWVAIFSTGEIRAYQVLISIIFLLNIPIAILCGYLELEPQYVYAGCCLINVTALIVRLYFSYKKVGLHLGYFMKQTIYPILLLSIFSALFLFGFYYFIHPANDFITFAWQSIVYIAFIGGLVFFVGLTDSEKSSIVQIMKLHFR